MSLNFHRDVPDIDLLSLIESYAITCARWDALMFFGRNPSAQMPVDRMAQMSGQSVRAVEHELDDLMGLGILRTSEVNRQKTYALAMDPSVRNAVIRFARRSAFD